MEPWPHTQVQELDLSKNDVDSEFAKTIAAALPHTQVQQLNLSYNYIGSEGAEALC